MYYGLMLSMQDNFDHLKSYVGSDGNRYAECATCRRHAEISAYEPETNDIPSWYMTVMSRETNWFEKMTKYNPTKITLLKTTIEELAEIWEVSPETIRRAFDKMRLIKNDYRIHVNSFPWEPQTTCIDCRHPYQAPEVPEDSALVS
jgi:hypothetical protein